MTLMVPAWVAAYVGVPWKDGGRDREGVDCWGLLRMIYAEQYGLLLPSYRESYRTAADACEVETMIRQEQPKTWTRVLVPQEGDAVLLRLLGHPTHTGLVVVAPTPVAGALGTSPTSSAGVAGLFLHVRAGTNACLERLDSPAWIRRILGFYRHRSRL